MCKKLPYQCSGIPSVTTEMRPPPSGELYTVCTLNILFQVSLIGSHHVTSDCLAGVMLHCAPRLCTLSSDFSCVHNTPTPSQYQSKSLSKTVGLRISRGVVYVWGMLGTK